MMLNPDCGYFNEEKDDEYAPPYGECEECYRYDICRKATIMEALAACSEYCCGECPYQHLDDKTYKLRCINVLIQDVYKYLKGKYDEKTV